MPLLNSTVVTVTTEFTNKNKAFNQYDCTMLQC